MLKKPGTGNFKAQSSVEFLLLLAVALVVLGAAIVISQQQTSDIVHLGAQTQARNTVQELAAAAREVYSQGEGARKQVFIELPSGYAANESFVANQSIKLRVGGSDLAESNDFPMYGSLPFREGSYWVWVVSEGNRVRIGAGMFSLNRASIHAVMERNSTHIERFTVRNIFNETIDIDMDLAWNPTAVTLALDATSFSLDPGGEREIEATFRSDSSALGFYNGYLDVTATAGSSSETQRLPITIEVVLPAVSESFRIVPSTWNETLLVNTSTAASFTVCTGVATSVLSVAFTTTPGAAGIWVGNLTALPAMAADTCLPKTFTLTVPAGTRVGVYGGAIFGSGGGDIEDSIALAINVTINTSDREGPLVRDVAHTPQPAYGGDIVTIAAVGDDSGTGNTPVDSCEIQLDGDGLWNPMTAVDGEYDEPVEDIEYNTPPLLVAHHTADLRCTDLAGNLGPTTTYLFDVIKELVFITKDEGAGGTEGAWMGWLDSHSSREGFSWEYDQVHRNRITDGDVDLSLYQAAIVTEDVTSGSVGVALIGYLLSYTIGGGSLVILGEAADKTPEELGVSPDGAYSANRRYIFINETTHYITSGLPAGYINIYPSNVKIWRQRTYSFAGTYLATTQSDRQRVVLGEADTNIFVWGPTNPSLFLEAGVNLTTRTIDYALLQSEIGE